MKKVKSLIWIIGTTSMIYCLYMIGIDKLSSWLQFVTSIGAVYGLGEFVEHKLVHWPRQIKLLESLHEKHDRLHEKMGGE